MTKKELLNNYRASVIELEELRRQLARLGTDGRPAGVRTMVTDSIARGTNDPAAAALQLADGLEDMLHRKEKEMNEMSQQVDLLLKSIRDFRTYMVIQHYYILAHTDEQIALAMAMSKSRVNQIRTGFLRAG